MKYVLSVLLVFCLVRTVTAQSIVVHGNPQKTIYNSPAEWPKYPSAQGHWDIDTTDTMPPCHAHVEPLTFPQDGELSATTSIVVNVQVQLFHCSGHLRLVWSDLGVIVLDQYGGWREYVDIPGDPIGLIVIPGKWYFDISRSDGNPRWQPPDHGWGHIHMKARVENSDGSSQSETNRIKFWSMRNPSAPIISDACDGCGPTAGSHLEVTSATDTNFNGWGDSYVEVRGPLPLAPLPLGALWNLNIIATTYGVDFSLPPGVLTSRVDMDLHNGNPGRQLANPFVIDTNELGLGDHKVALLWTTETGACGGTPRSCPGGFSPHESTTSLFVIPVTVGDGTIEPPTCQDPTATNFGGPLPCVFPPPPPDWNTITGVLQRKGPQGRVCDQSEPSVCWSLGVAIP